MREEEITISSIEVEEADLIAEVTEIIEAEDAAADAKAAD